MKSHIIRLACYIVFAIIMVIAVSMHKQTIIKQRESIPPSVLGIIVEKGVPVKTHAVKEENIQRYLRVSVEQCGSTFCFYVTTKNGKEIPQRASVFTASTYEKIGTVTHISGFDPMTGLAKVTVGLDKVTEEFKNNKFNIINVGTQLVRNVLAVPTSSIDYDESSSFVWLYNDGQPQKQEITLGVQSEIFSEVKSGLKKGDLIVTEGQGLLYQFTKARQIESSEEKSLN